MSEITDIIKMKEMVVLKKSEKKKKGYTKIEGLDPANNAGGKLGYQCSLILCEGLSAKTYAVAGIQKGVYDKSGRDWYGILSLTGKCLNVRNSIPTTIAKNKVITSLIQALNIKHDLDYTDDKNYKTLSYGKIILLTDADSVTFDTPCILKNIETNEIEIKPICEINDNMWTEDIFTTKQYSMCDKYLVWSDKGWTKIKSIMRHKINKKIFRVLSRTGCVDVTEDHSLLNKNGEKITAKDCIIKKTELLHNKYTQEKTNMYNINKEYAYALGYFQAFGNCVNGSNWYVEYTDRESLKKLRLILEKHENYFEDGYDTKLRFEIKKIEESKFILQAKGVIKNILIKYKNMFYNTLREKQVPKEILNSPIEIQKAFLHGFYGTNKVYDNFKVEYKSQTMGLFQVLQNCGYKPTINYSDNSYYISICKYNDKPEYTVKKIIDVSKKYENTYVYDFETENHHFHASIGNMIVHNTDGLHISGLIMNFLHYLFPSILERKEPYLVSMCTPIVRVFNPKGDLLFYDENRFKQYSKDQTKTFKSKYYKGLGTTKPEDVPDTFGLKMIEYNNDENSNTSMNKVFHKNFSDVRKEWLENYDPNPEFCLDDKGKIVNMDISSFLNNEVIKFSHSDCKRSIPSLFDGLKTSQRKVLYSVKKRHLTYNKTSLKVAQLGGYVAEHSNYHHGEQNLFDTIIKMAQDFVGSNNIPILYRDGMFGCVDPDTEILLWNGNIIKAKYIKVNDELIGDDGTKRIVSKTIKGFDTMYEIEQEYGNSYKVNSEHILTLYYPGNKTCPSKIFDINIQEYLKLPKHMKDELKGVPNDSIIDWETKEVLIDPYIFGKWVTKSGEIDIIDDYLINDKETRLQFLAGIIDMNCVLKNKYCGESYFEISNYSHLFEKFEFLCRSLGFRTRISDKTLSIFGYNLDIIPTKLFRKKLFKIFTKNKTYYYPISVKEIEPSEYVGWNIDKNERFLLGDFTVTHNTRIVGGKDAASPRYIFTKMESITPYIFREEDDVLLDYIEDDGDLVEPKFYVPIIPMILVNGAVGIGTGWSSTIPMYNPLDVIECIKVWLDNDGEVLLKDPDDGSILSILPEIHPWYRGFEGVIKKFDNKYITYGVANKNKDKIEVTELPIGMCTDKFKETLEDWLVDKQIKNMKNYSTPNKVNFVITESEDGFICNIDNMGLYTYLHTSNMVLFNEKEQIKKYNVDEIINEFCIVRYKFYTKRKNHIISTIKKELKHLGNKERFIKEIIEGKLKIMNIEEEIIIKELEKRKYDKETDSEENNTGYNYLLKLSVRTLTSNQVKKINNDIQSLKLKLENITKTSEKQMWKNDLKDFENEYTKWLKKMNEIKNVKPKKISK